MIRSQTNQLWEGPVTIVTCSVSVSRGFESEFEASGVAGDGLPTAYASKCAVSGICVNAAHLDACRQCLQLVLPQFLSKQKYKVCREKVGSGWIKAGGGVAGKEKGSGRSTLANGAGNQLCFPDRDCLARKNSGGDRPGETRRDCPAGKIKVESISD